VCSTGKSSDTILLHLVCQYRRFLITSVYSSTLFLPGLFENLVGSEQKLSVWCEKMTLSELVDIMVAKAFAMLGFIRRLALEFRDPFNLKSLYKSLVRLKLEYARCVWNPFYDVRVDRVERVQRRFIRYALRLG
jgi:hypothetical protein